MANSRGRPSKYESDVKPRFNEIQEWLELGATEKEVYKNLRLSKDAWIKYKRKYKELNDLIKNSRKTPVIQIKQAMLKRALGFQYEEKKVISQKIELPNEIEEVLNENGVKFSTSPKIVRTEVTTKTALPSEAAGLILLQHWDLDEKGNTKWSRDPASRELKKEELELKKEAIENERW